MIPEMEPVTMPTLVSVLSLHSDSSSAEGCRVSKGFQLAMAGNFDLNLTGNMLNLKPASSFQFGDMNHLH
jgi:hypothetical protein